MAHNAQLIPMQIHHVFPFIVALAIRNLIAISCTRWRFILKRLSQDRGRTDFSKNFIISPFNDDLSVELDTTLSQLHRWTVPLKLALLVWKIHMLIQFQHQTTKQLKGTLIKWSYFLCFLRS
jgi:hypothetical protein